MCRTKTRRTLPNGVLTVDGGCYESYPCLHHIYYARNDGVGIGKRMVSGAIINGLFQLAGKHGDEHFGHYDDVTKKDDAEDFLRGLDSQ